ncbi:MAG: hypothetical protein CBD47_02050 [Synechococcus sp. TMED187]|uniref:hypothetical protein n=1 Tax=unclassified Synechococcus TaxID=2626047 RepID=UPI000B69F5D0|nr:hypothetical protein [Synechococcus sp. UW105]MAS28684.1 hypothetical protein [Synechococcus sp. NAT40]OUW49296.1 MAG: hypothetical protein CBD47_02050 [Synechococcus sp. TMED187]RZO14320.1 MAG: hypothetical protein EVB08_03405 [Synechococcus sp. MED-G135]
MTHDLRWTLLAWSVCAVAAAFKFARLARQMRGSLSPNPERDSSKAVRARLERIWQKDLP